MFTLTEEAFAGRGYVLSPRWLSNVAWMIERRLVKKPNREILECEAAMEEIYRTHLCAAPKDEGFAAKMLDAARRASVEHIVTERIFRATPGVDLVYMEPLGLLDRRYVEAFSLWGRTFLAPAADGKSPLFEFQDGEPCFGIMPCRMEQRFYSAAWPLATEAPR